MWPFIGLTIALFVGLSFTTALMRREEIKANWSKYKDDLLYMFAAPLFKPDDDPRSPVQFATDNFSDVMMEKVTQMFAIFLQPVFQIFKLFTDALMQTLNGLFNIKSLLGNMWNKWNEVFAMFMRRFYGIFNQLRLTFVRLFDAFGRVYGMAVSSVYQALSLIDSIRSFVDLMIIIAIAILVILLAMLIFLFLFMWPLIPVIVLAIAVIAAAGLGGAVGGMGEAFCFAEATPVATDHGPQPIEKLNIGTRLSTGATVLGTMMFEPRNYDLYDLWGVQVSGSHIVFDSQGTPCHVSNHPSAKPLRDPTPRRVYCLITSDQRIPIQTTQGQVMFADWEELPAEAEEGLRAWHKHVFTTLNPDVPYKEPSRTVLASEAAVSGKTHVWTPLGRAEIRGLCPGATILDADGKHTRVRGVVKVDSSLVKEAYPIGPDAFVSAGAWMRTGKQPTWSQPEQTAAQKTDAGWYSLFTESGSFRLCEDVFTQHDVRDFSDVGSDKIHETYEWVLEALGRNE